MKKLFSKLSAYKYYFFLHLIIFQLSFGGVLSKFASKTAFLSIEFCLLYGLMLINLGVYAILWQQIIKKLPLTSAFCNKAVSIIWGMLWGVMIFAETISWNMIVGAIIVLVGVVLVVKSDG
ncbi:MAG: transporter [Ruminococcaceae bacterium]|nr:transporter [Oscillospiraceae bacterium]